MYIEETAAIKEARRVMEVCNACRYCGGFCAVFPAMEKRTSFPKEDLEYLSNLCHNCTSCFHACQYAPPQEFDLNCPKAMAELRAETYQKYAWPAFFAGLFQNNGTVVSLVTAFCVAIVLLMTYLLQGAETVLATHTGDGSFYHVIPYDLMLGLPIFIALFVMLALGVGTVRFIHGMGWKLTQLTNIRNLVSAFRDTMILCYLGGSGEGCNYENETFSNKRRWLHQLVLFGFISCTISTLVAGIYDHFFHWQAPYSYTSIPVVTGTAGGLGLTIGTAGLLWLKLKRDQRPMVARLLGMDVAFSLQLFLTSLSGLLLLFFRETAAMGTLLAVHLGFVAALFLILPYSKFVHAIYRFIALIRFADEGPYRSEP